MTKVACIVSILQRVGGGVLRATKGESLWRLAALQKSNLLVPSPLEGREPEVVGVLCLRFLAQPQPIGVEHAILIRPLERVGPEVIALRLQQVGGQVRATVTVVVGERR